MRVLFLAALASVLWSAEPKPVVDVTRVWSKAPHNAFTDLVRFRDRWYLAFREGAGAFSPDGRIRLLSSADGERWNESAVLSMEGADLRDPKLSVTPRQTLAVSTAAAYPEGSPKHHQSVMFFSSDGRDFSNPVEVGDPNVWMWRVNWGPSYAFSIGFSTWGPPLLRLYTSTDGVRWKSLVDELLTDNYPNESSILFQQEVAWCLLRRDKGPATALLGSSRPPYRTWAWRDTGVRLGSPRLVSLPDGRVIAAASFAGESHRTALVWVDLEDAKLSDLVRLPSGGDTGYPGAVFHDGVLWVSYHSSHEGKASIYIAKVKLSAPAPAAKPAKSWMPPKKY